MRLRGLLTRYEHRIQVHRLRKGLAAPGVAVEQAGWVRGLGQVFSVQVELTLDDATLVRLNESFPPYQAALEDYAWWPPWSTGDAACRRIRLAVMTATMPAPAGVVAAVRADSVSKVYRLGSVTVPALVDVSLAVAPGEMVCIMGKSGSGKSTLLRQLGLIDRPTSGRILLEGEEVTSLSESRRAGLRLDRLGYVFQEYALIASLTAQENVYLPALMQGQRRSVCRSRSAELLAQVELGDRLKHRPKGLSGGEQQRVAIARALVNGPVILFADEPTANLDSLSGRTVMETLTRLNQELGITVVFVSHDPDDQRWAHRVVTLHDGRIGSDAPVQR